MSNLGLRLNGVVMLALLAGGGAMSAYVMATPELRATLTKPLPSYGYLDGTLTASLEGTYKNELPVKSGSSEILNAVTVSLFGQGRKGVLIGKDGWLFSSEEYAWTDQSEHNLEANLKQVGAIAAELKARGISLEIALIPEKADIYADRLGQRRPAVHAGQYEKIRQRLVAATGLAVPDLRGPLLAMRPSTDVFFPTDTHWTVAGSAVAAKVIATAFSAGAAITPASFTLRPEQPQHHAGDLLRFVELGPFKSLLPATADLVTPLVAVADGGSVDAFLSDGGAGDDPALALVGTSYSANVLWSFESQLKAALGRDLLNLAEEGHGPMLPMEAFLKSVEAKRVSVKAVIWEIPLRYLDDTPVENRV